MTRLDLAPAVLSTWRLDVRLVAYVAVAEAYATGTVPRLLPPAPSEVVIGEVVG